MDDPTPIVDAPSKPPLRFRRTRIAVSVFFGVLTVALCVLWVRSYWRWDILSRRDANITQLGSNSGYVYFVRTKLPAFVRDWGSTPHGWHIRGKAANIQPARFASTKTQNKLGLRIPYWFLTPATGLAAGVAAPWAKSRFSLRTMFIATTLVAVVLGLGVCLAG